MTREKAKIGAGGAAEPTEQDDGQKTFRTTVSLPGTLAAPLKQVAEQKRLSVIETIRVAVQQFVEFESRSGPVASVAPLLETVRLLTNRYKAMAAAWRLGRVGTQIKGIEAGRLTLFTHSPETYLLLVVAELHAALGDGDEFFVVTTRPFWEKAHKGAARSLLGPDEFREYLKAQGEAIGRGMRLERVIVLDGEKRRASDELVELHRRFVHEVRERYPDCAELIRTRILIPSTPDQLGHDFKPFAVIRRRMTGDLASSIHTGECFVIEPHYTAENMINEIRLVFSDGVGDPDSNTRAYFERFEIARAGSIPIEEYQSQS